MQNFFDIDGVISKDPVGLSRKPFIQAFLNDVLLFFPPGTFFYLNRLPNERVKAWMKKRKIRGEEIGIVSGISKVHYPLVKRWLDRNEIPYDELWLRPPNEEIAEFKARILQERNSRFYLEDDPKIAKKIMAILGEQIQGREWMFQQQKFFLLKLKGQR